jgi:selenocysteine-specific elongation factor
MKRLVVGVIGHVDHGKTALVQALTGQDTDRLPEEKARGISIALGFAHFKAEPGTEIDLIDMPGHERFVRTMISGATGIDAVLLVVAANEGIQPQSIEHVDIAALLGLRRAVVAISKTDLVAPEEAARVPEEAMRLLARAGMDAASPILTSTLLSQGMDELGQSLVALAANQPPRPADGLAFLPIDRAFGIAGHGPVVTGTLRGGPVSVGDLLDLLPLRRRVRVRTVQVHGTGVTAAMPGQRVALNLRNVELAELARGMMLAVPDSLTPSTWITIALRAVEGAPPLRNGMKLRAFLGTDEQDVRLRLLDRDQLEPGDSGFAQLRFAQPVSIPAREPVILRLSSPAQTVAGGPILEPATQRLRRHAPRTLERLNALSTLPLPAMIAGEVKSAGGVGTTLRHLSQLTALSPARVRELLRSQPVLVTRSEHVFRQFDLDRLLARIPALLASHPEGLAQDEIQSALPGAGVSLLEEALGQLLARKAVVKRGSRIAMPNFARARARDEAELAARIAEDLRGAALTPPLPSEIRVDAAARRAVDRLLREGRVIRCVDRAKGKEMLFHRDAIEDVKRRLVPLLEIEPGLLVTEIAAALGLSRKFTMPLLDHLDTIRFTQRGGDRRMLYAAAMSGHEQRDHKKTDRHETAQEQL